MTMDAWITRGGGRWARRQSGSRLRTRRSGSGQWAAGGLWLVAAVVLVGGCSGSQHPASGADPQLRETAQLVSAGDDSAQGPETAAENATDPRKMSIIELNDGPGVLELGVSKLLEQVGVLELLESYLINVPFTAAFISDFDAIKARAASRYLYAGSGDAGDVLRRFEREVLFHVKAATAAAVDFGVEGAGSRVLHDAFFEALAQCGRDSQWPQVRLFVLHEGRGYDEVPDLIEATYGLSYYEFQQLKHECARYAATYPSLDETTRDELLAPQRDHYARAVLDGLAANPRIEVPDRYRDEWTELQIAGW